MSAPAAPPDAVQPPAAQGSSVVPAALPVAAAIGVFGVIYGATAPAVLGTPMTLASSVLMFSGVAQFAIVGLLETGASVTGVVVAVALLGLRHVPLAAVLRPRLPADRGRRAGLALLLVDETVGLALASPRSVARTVVVAGGLLYGAWVLGTVLGVLGADLVAVASLASVVFVTLFVGLTALTCRGRADVVRAVVTGMVAVVLLLVVPGVGVAGVMAVALIGALVGAGPRGSAVSS